jgi:acyl carrier protein
MQDESLVRSRIKEIIVSSLNLEGMLPASIGDEDPLFGEGLGLDSVDALELVVALEKEYGITVESHEIERNVFSSVATLADFVVKCRPSVSAEPTNG